MLGAHTNSFLEFLSVCHPAGVVDRPVNGTRSLSEILFDWLVCWRGWGFSLSTPVDLSQLLVFLLLFWTVECYT